MTDKNEEKIKEELERDLYILLVGGLENNKEHIQNVEKYADVALKHIMSISNIVEFYNILGHTFSFNIDLFIEYMKNIHGMLEGVDLTKMGDGDIAMLCSDVISVFSNVVKNNIVETDNLKSKLNEFSTNYQEFGSKKKLSGLIDIVTTGIDLFKIVRGAIA